MTQTLSTVAKHIAILIAVALAPIGSAAQSVPAQLFSDMHWRLIGPFRAGRVVAVSGVPGDATTFYFGGVDGGVWKTTNAGTTWKPIFDGQPVASIGALAVSASNPNVIYAGTGESDIRSDLASGDGVYRSTDAGVTWKNVGLKDTRQISKIVIDPTNADVVYAGALGHAYGPNDERGVYKSVDGGTTWRRVLNKGQDVGVADLTIAVSKPTVLFASLWNAHRPPWSTYGPLGGHGSGLYRSEDAGESWQECSGHGLPEGTWGRSGVAVSADGRRVYALVEAAKSGLYVSDDGGANWKLANDDARLTSRAWYFSRITVDPTDADVIYMPNVALMGSRDGGKTVFVVRGAPGGDDYHEIWVDPKEPSRMILGVDQGTTISVDKGKTWTTWYNQSTAQMYHVTTDDAFPYVVYGAQQDSGSAAVYSRTNHGQITPRDWFPAGGSESGYLAVDPKDSNIIYASGSYGTVARWDRARSLSQDISPWPAPVFGTEINTRKYRDPWTPPLVFSPVDKTSLYMGTQYVMKTVDGGLHWAEISGDLTGAKATRPAASASAVKTGPAASAMNPATDTGMDAPTPTNAIERGYGALATVAPSYLDKDVIWAGSDTGVVSVTRDGGKSWANVTPRDLQPWSRVSLIEPSHFNGAVAYAAVERHRMDDQAPYIYRTRDYGKTWEAITSGLAAPAFVNAVREDPKQKGLLYAGTEFGMYVSFNDGDSWEPLQLNLPVTSIRDMMVHGDDLVIATHGRSFWILDDVTPLREAAEKAKSEEPFLYQPEMTVRVDSDGFPGTPLPPEEPTAENPPNGAILDYFLPTKASKIALQIYDGDHKMVRHFSSDKSNVTPHTSLPIAARWFPVPARLETSPGMHRFVWDLAWGTTGVAEDDEPDDGEGDIPRGPRIAPGSYSLELEVDGKKSAVETLVVVMDPRSKSGAADLKRQFETSYAMFTASLESRRGLAEIGSVQEQLSKISADPSSANLSAKAKDLSATIAGLLAGSENSMGLDAANASITATLNVAESSDRATPAQALALFAEAHTASQARIEQWATLKKGALAYLNGLLKSQGRAPIEVAAIEREVYYLMTR